MTPARPSAPGLRAASVPGVGMPGVNRACLGEFFTGAKVWGRAALGSRVMPRACPGIPAPPTRWPCLGRMTPAAMRHNQTLAPRPAPGPGAAADITTARPQL